MLRDLVIGSRLEFEERGAYQLKGMPGEWRLFAVTSTFGVFGETQFACRGKVMEVVPGSVVDVRRWIGEGEIPRMQVRPHQIAVFDGH